jgi:hypothetical protein
MFFVSIPASEMPQLEAEGVAMRINGRPELLRRKGDYLHYGGMTDGEQRCKILSLEINKGLASYTCLSHGQDEATMISVGGFPPAVVIQDGNGRYGSGIREVQQ